MSYINGKEIVAIQNLCRLRMNLTIHEKDARARIITWVPSDWGVIFLLFDMILRVGQNEFVY